MASDASASWGMAGALFFGEGDCSHQPFDGFFWQITWPEWEKIIAMGELVPGSVGINVAEFLAALITCETFSPFCLRKITTIEIDNRAAISWLDSARCPRYPFDRCAQGLHLYMLKGNMKIQTSWVPSEDNRIADTFSREFFSMSPKGHRVEGKHMLKVKPKWQHVRKFI